MGYSCVFKVYTNVSMAGEGITWTPNRANSAFNDWKYDLSPDGRWLAFSDPATSAYFPEPVSTGVRNIGLRDLFSQTNVLISCQYSNTLQVANGPSTDPSFSPDGRWLLFYSQASDLIANQTGSFIFGLFAFDRQANTMRFISRANSLTGAVFSANSQYVAFSAYEPLTTIPTVYRFDMLGTNPVPEKVAGYGINPTISTNGQWIAFQLQKTGSMADIYVADAAAGTQELISVGLDGVSGGNRNSSAPQISPDGRFVLFASQADNLVPGDANAVTDIFLRDRQLGLTYLLSANPKTGHAGNGPSTSPVMSTDGSTVVFASYANDLFAGDFNDKQDVFVVKLTGGDRDGDGLDDAWEMVYFGNLDRDGSGDFDGDGLTDREEYRAGTDPANRGSVLRALVMAPVGGSSTTLRWPAAKDGHYQVQFKRSVTDAEWTVLTTTITVTGNTASATDEGAGLDAARFYRIVMLR
jgi:Tol biopolymer transport system component